jgi:hypothetical protein
MRYVVTYSRMPLQLADGRWTTDCFLLRDRASSAADTASAYATRAEAMIAAAVLNGESSRPAVL